MGPMAPKAAVTSCARKTKRSMRQRDQVREKSEVELWYLEWDGMEAYMSLAQVLTITYSLEMDNTRPVETSRSQVRVASQDRECRFVTSAKCRRRDSGDNHPIVALLCN
jgi:hypothetical protein